MEELPVLWQPALWYWQDCVLVVHSSFLNTSNNSQSGYEDCYRLKVASARSLRVHAAIFEGRLQKGESIRLAQCWVWHTLIENRLGMCLDYGSEVMLENHTAYHSWRDKQDLEVLPLSSIRRSPALKLTGSLGWCRCLILTGKSGVWLYTGKRWIL